MYKFVNSCNNITRKKSHGPFCMFLRYHLRGKLHFSCFSYSLCSLEFLKHEAKFLSTEGFKLINKKDNYNIVIFKPPLN